MIITLVKPPDEATPAQLAVYELLAERKKTNLEEMRDRLGLRSILPVRSRLEHLAAKGIIAIG